jgi:Transposase DDE domain
VGYDAGKKVKGRKIHALVDTLGLPMRVVVHSAGLQDRDGAALLLDKIRRRFPWLELVWADGGYNARQVDQAVAGVPASGSKSSSAATTRKGLSYCRAAGSSNAPSPGSAATGVLLKTTKTSPTPCSPSSH